MVDLIAEVGEVLVQAAAERDVEDLCATTDAQYRDPTRTRTAGELDLEAVQVGLGRPQRRVRLGAVRGGMDVRTAGEAERVESVEQRIDLTGGYGREDHRHAAAEAHGLEVALAERELLACGLAVGDHVVVVDAAHLRRGDADQRRRAHMGPLMASGSSPERTDTSS